MVKSIRGQAAHRIPVVMNMTKGFQAARKLAGWLDLPQDGISVRSREDPVGKFSLRRTAVRFPSVHTAVHLHLEGRAETRRAGEGQFQAAVLFPKVDRQDDLLPLGGNLAMEKIQGRGLFAGRDPDAAVPFRQGAAHSGYGHPSLRNRQHDDRIPMNDLRISITILPRYVQHDGQDRYSGQVQGKETGTIRAVLLHGTRGKEERRHQETEDQVRRHTTGIWSSRGAR